MECASDSSPCPTTKTAPAECPLGCSPSPECTSDCASQFACPKTNASTMDCASKSACPMSGAATADCASKSACPMSDTATADCASKSACPMAGVADPVKQSRYMPGLTPAVVFVAALSSLAFVGVVIAAVVVAAVQAFFFFLLPLAAAGGGAFLMVSPNLTPLGSATPTVLLLVRALGALALAYAGGAMLVGASGCPKSRCMHLKLMTAVLGALTLAASAADEAELPAEFRAAAGYYLLRMTGAALVGAVITAAGPGVTKRIQAGKPGSPQVLVCS